MDTLGLNATDFAIYQTGLLRPHMRRVTVDILRVRDHRYVDTIVSRVTSGTVTADLKGEPSGRICELTAVDPGRSLRFDPDSAGTPIHRSHELQVTDWRLIPDLGWVPCDVHVGPMIDYDRSEGEVRIVAHGRDVLARGARWAAKTWPKKTRKTVIIRGLLSGTGATYLVIPNLPRTTPERTTVDKYDISWQRAEKMASSMDKQLLADNRGRYVMRSWPTRPCIHFGATTPGRPGALLKSPAWNPNEGGPNTFIVLGKKTKGKNRIRAVESLPPNHDMSPHELRQEGVPFRRIRKTENAHIKTEKEAHQKARRQRDAELKTAVEISAEVMPIPNLWEGDMASLDTDFGRVKSRLRSLVLPLDENPEGTPMQIGQMKRLSDTTAMREWA